jgi:hypothetical protein
MNFVFMNSLKRAWQCWVTVACLLAFGCGRDAPSDSVVEATIAGPVEPTEIELSNATATFEAPNVVRLLVDYRFVKGGPRNFYCAQIEFPGTENVGVKYMEGWELQDSGVLKSGLVLKTLDVKEFKVQITEALLPQDGYKPISNVVTGQVEGVGEIADPATP